MDAPEAHSCCINSTTLHAYQPPGLSTTPSIGQMLVPIANRLRSLRLDIRRRRLTVRELDILPVGQAERRSRILVATLAATAGRTPPLTFARTRFLRLSGALEANGNWGTDEARSVAAGGAVVGDNLAVAYVV